MNRVKNTIGWCDLTWNPITGCLHGCWYCYAHKMFTRFHRSFEPTFHPERLNDPAFEKLPRGTKIFVCSVSDLFAPWTKVEWRDAVIEKISRPEYGHLIFQLLTKNPENIPNALSDFDIDYRNFWIGATITNRNDQHLDSYMKHVNGLRFLSFEPLLGPVNCNLVYIHWIIIGKLTGSKKVPLQKEWVQYLIDQARKQKIPVFIKNNVGWPEKIQEFPK